MHGRQDIVQLCHAKYMSPYAYSHGPRRESLPNISTHPYMSICVRTHIEPSGKTGGSDANQALIANMMDPIFEPVSHSSLLPGHRYRYSSLISTRVVEYGPGGILGLPGWSLIGERGQPSLFPWLSSIYVAFLYEKMALPAIPSHPPLDITSKPAILAPCNRASYHCLASLIACFYSLPVALLEHSLQISLSPLFAFTSRVTSSPMAGHLSILAPLLHTP